MFKLTMMDWPLDEEFNLSGVWPMDIQNPTLNLLTVSTVKGLLSAQIMPVEKFSSFRKLVTVLSYIKKFIN